MESFGIDGKYSLSWVHVLQCPAKGMMCSCIAKLALLPLNARGYVSCKVTVGKWLDSTGQSPFFFSFFVIGNQRTPLGSVVFWQMGWWWWWWWWLQVNCSVSLPQFAALSQTPLRRVFNGNPESVCRIRSATLWPPPASLVDGCISAGGSLWIVLSSCLCYVQRLRVAGLQKPHHRKCCQKSGEPLWN